MSDKGRWFRVYALQVRDHDKFRSLTGLEIGAWTVLRAEAELRTGAVFADRAEAVLVLKRRKIPRPAAMLDRLVALALFDVDDRGRVAVHDRADHDRPFYPSDTPEQVAERKRQSRNHEPVTNRDTNGVTSGEDSGHDTHAGVLSSKPPQPSETAYPPSQPDGALPAETDSATFACRKFINGGTWLGNPEYVEAWDDMDRRYGAERVQSEIDPAYARLHERNPRVKPWELKHAVELACAEWIRGQEIERDRALAAAQRAERARLKEKADSATDEEKRRASITRRAIGLWIKRRPHDPVPEDFDELEAWLSENETQPTAGAA